MHQEDTSTLSIVDSSGRQVSILNHHQDASPITSLLQPPPPLPTQNKQYEQQQDDTIMGDTSATTTIRRKYVCNASGCFKSFTTSGHLARHHRIHTGEKNFPCLYPGCQSRFSRQDNMMQHYRTHMSPKSRRSKKQQQSQQQQQPQQQSLADRSHPRLHAHHRILSDTTAPLTIDQHLQKYHQSRLDHSHQYHIRIPPSLPPLSSTSHSSSIPSSSSALPRPTIGTTITNNTSNGNTISSHSSSPQQSATPATPIKAESSTLLPLLLPPLQSSPNSRSPPLLPPAPPSADIFYQHRPLKYSATEGESTYPTTLLNPTPIKTSTNDTTTKQQDESSSPSSSSSSNSLIQLANIVSSFG